MFGGGGRCVRVWTSLFFYLSCIYFFCACIYFFCAFLKNRQNKLHFSVSANFSVCVLSRTENSYNYSVGFRIFLLGYFGTDRIIVIFLCVPKKRTEKFVTHRAIRVSSSCFIGKNQETKIKRLPQVEAPRRSVCRSKGKIASARPMYSIFFTEILKRSCLRSCLFVSRPSSSSQPRPLLLPSFSTFPLPTPASSSLVASPT